MGTFHAQHGDVVRDISATPCSQLDVGKTTPVGPVYRFIMRVVGVCVRHILWVHSFWPKCSPKQRPHSSLPFHQTTHIDKMITKQCLNELHLFSFHSSLIQCWVKQLQANKNKNKQVNNQNMLRYVLSIDITCFKSTVSSRQQPNGANVALLIKLGKQFAMTVAGWPYVQRGEVIFWQFERLF